MSIEFVLVWMTGTVMGVFPWNRVFGPEGYVVQFGGIAILIVSLFM